MRLLLALVGLIFAWSFGLTPAWAQSLQPGDTISISVYQDSKLDRQIVIGSDGYISFPLAGQLRAAGLTPVGLSDALKARLKDKYAGQLDITVSLVKTATPEAEKKPRIYVTGQVSRPGYYIIEQRITVLQAIALSGGLTPFAAGHRVQVHRKVRGVETTYVFDYASFQSGWKLAGNINLRPGDVVIVPERGLFDVFW